MHIERVFEPMGFMNIFYIQLNLDIVKVVKHEIRGWFIEEKSN